MKKILLVIVSAVVLIIVGFYALNTYIYQEKQADRKSVMIEGEPTDFAEIGTVTIVNPETTSDAPILVYEKPGQPALTHNLVFDALSFCMHENSAVPCVVMSQTFAAAFGETRVAVEGIETDAGVLVRKIRTIHEGNPFVVAEPGSIFISWPQARAIIKNCQATQVMQTHALDVYITLEDERRVRTVEPAIDDIFDILRLVQGSCPQIPMATE